MTGNDEEIVSILQKNLQNDDLKVTTQELSFTDVTDIKDNDCLIVVTYTYDDGEVPEPALDLYEDLEGIQLPGRVFGVCGSGDTFYEDFCVAVDNFEKRLLKTGATKGAQSVKVELFPEDDDQDKLREFSKDLVRTVKENV
ncbi:flavodoxin [Lactobacillus sp. DCY120]|uniref:Flavodoxin n=2 Tax=Bombilactobacillus apium TaxID=2675299 RepID=A0A850R7S6_9LACO|nr:flavodoxin [Bombilactobacillus apium]